MDQNQEQEKDSMTSGRRKSLAFWDARSDVPWADPEEKRTEVEEAILGGRIRDPISAIVAVGVSLVSSWVASIFAPKPPPVRQGELHGEVSGLMSSQAGQLIPEIYSSDFDAPVRNVWMVRRCN